MKQICDIYRSSRDTDMYLYVLKSDGLERVPEPLMEKFGRADHAMTLVLHPEKKLARADISKVLAELDDKGYYLQLPPLKDPNMQAVHQRNDKFSQSK